LLIEHQLGHQAFESLDLSFELTDMSRVIGLGRTPLRSPAEQSDPADPQLSAYIGDRESLVPLPEMLAVLAA
jgi:hypothetical protein